MIDPQQAVLAGNQREVPRLSLAAAVVTCLAQLTDDQKRVLSLMNTALSRPYSLPG